MAESYKEQYNPQSIATLAKILAGHATAFSLDAFIADACDQIESLEFKARSHQITDALIRHLPSDFSQAVSIILASLAPDFEALGVDAAQAGWTRQDFAAEGISGWMIMPCADFVARKGLTETYFALSMSALEAMTSRFSAEFAIRPFLHTFPESTLAQCLNWTQHPNQHVRRLASEGTRPTLPWGMKLSTLGANPTLSYPILDALKDDPSAYVRKSVANHLNDHSKQHPDWVCETAHAWWQLDKPRQRLLKHACRTLIKQGHMRTLSLFGFNEIQAKVRISLSKTRLVMGGTLDIQLCIKSTSIHHQPLLIDYVIWHQKANGTKRPKVFKWKEMTLGAEQQIALVKSHTIKPITTRTYHSGEHSIEIQINGKVYERADFVLEC